MQFTVTKRSPLQRLNFQRDHSCKEIAVAEREKEEDVGREKLKTNYKNYKIRDHVTWSDKLLENIRMVCERTAQGKDRSQKLAFFFHLK